MLLLLALLPRALSDETATGSAAAAPAVPATAIPAPAIPAPAIRVTVGPISSVAKLAPVDTSGLQLTSCVGPHTEPMRDEPNGTLVLEVRVRRGKAALVTVASGDPSVTDFAPCFVRELTAYPWPVKHAVLTVPVYVGTVATDPAPVP